MEPSPDITRVPSRARRLLVATGLALGIALAAGLTLLLVLQAPPVRALVLERAAGWARAHLGLELRAVGLDYDLMPPAVDLRSLTLASTGSPSRPFFTADRVRLQLSWRALLGEMDIDRLAITRPAITIAWHPDGTSNLPAFEQAPATEAAAPRPFFIRDLEVTGLDALVGTTVRTASGTPTSATTLAMRDVAIAMRSDRPQWLEGTLIASQGLRLDLEDAAIVVDRATASVAFDGHRVDVRSLEADAAGGTIRATGSIALLGEPARLDLDVTSNVELSRAAGWFEPAPPISGPVRLRGKISGPTSRPEITFELDGRGLGWGGLAASAVKTTGSVGVDGLDLDSVTLAVAGGTLQGRGRLAFQDKGASALEAHWADIDGRQLTRALAGAPPWLPPLATSGRASLTWTGRIPSERNLQGAVTGTARVGGRAPDGSLVEPGTFTARGASGRWHVSARQPLRGRTTIELDADTVLPGDAWARAQLAGTATLRSENPTEALDALKAFGLAVPDLGDVSIEGPATFDGRLSGTLADPRLTGAASLADITIPPLAPLQLHASITADRRRLDVERLVVDTPSARAEARGSLPFGVEPVAGSFSLTAADLSALAPGLDSQLRPGGTLSFSGDLSGTLRDPIVTGSFLATPLAVGDTEFDRVEGRLRYGDREVSLEQVSFAQGPHGRGTIQGYIGLDGALRGLRVTAAELHAAPWPGLELDIASLEGDVDGRIESLRSRVTVTTARTLWGGRDLGPARATAAVTDGVADIEAGLASLNATVSGKVATREPYAFDARVTLANVDLAQAVLLMAPDPGAIPRVEGTLAADGRLSGSLSDLSRVTARVDLTRLDGTAAGLPVRLRAPAQFRADEGVLAVRDLALDVAGLWATLDGGLAQGSTLLLTLQGPLEGLNPWIATLDPDSAWRTQGQVNAELQVGGPLAALIVTGRARGSVAELARGSWPVVRTLSFDAVLDSQRIQFTRVQGTVVDSQLDATASAPTSWLTRAFPAWIRLEGQDESLAAALDARIRVDVPAALRSAGQELPAGVTGSLSGVVRATAARPALEAIVGDVIFDEAGFVGFDQRFTQNQPTRFRVADGRVAVEACEFTGPQSRLTASGGLGFAPGTVTDFRVEGGGSLRIADLLLPGRAVGQIQWDVRFTGTPGETRMSGDLALKNASLLLPRSRFSLADWNGELAFGPGHLDVRDLRGQFNGGDVTIQGRLSTTAGSPGPGGAPSPEANGIRIDARGVFLEVPQGLRSQADATLSWTRAGAGSTIGGTITLVSSTYREPVTRMLELVDALAGRKGSGSDWGVPEELEDVALDIALTSNDPAIFENSLGRIEMVPNLRMVGTLGAPALSGTIDSLDGGRLRISGRTYRLRESTLRFSPIDGVVPTLNVIGETRIGEYDVTTRITGTPTSLETSFSSDPPLPERDLRSLVVTGRTESAQVSDSGGGDSFAVAAASADVLGFAGQFVGLDSVRLGAADLELVSADVKPTQHLTISKTLGRQFEIIVSENLEDNTLTWVFVWRPSSRFQVRLSSRENTEQAIEFRHEVPFGPGARSATPARSTSHASRKSRVTQVDITGNPGFGPEVVLSQLKLTAGKTFDFRQWLDDRERLERFYLEQGYAAARIVPTRNETPDTGARSAVTLAYRVLRGPKTELVIEGADLPGRVVEDMEAAWADASVPDFLRGDMTRIVRAHLSEEGYLQANVEATGGELQAGRSRIVVRIEPGPHFSRRQLAFSGNTAVTSEELRQFAAKQGLDRSGWTDPEGLIRMVEDQYALRGYLQAKVSVDPPLFDGDLATLPVRSVEGPRASIAGVVVDGAAPGREADARAALGLSVGETYVRHAERPARRRLEEHYRALGYRDAKTSVRAQVSDDGARVTITAHVEEGPLHVVQHVKVTGVESANRSLIDRAITLEPGSPASQSAVAETRKRLYDTGIFRSADIQFEPAPGAPGETQGQWPVDAVVAVEEARRYLLRYGVEFSTEYDSRAGGSSQAFGFSADLRDRNFFGRGIAAGIGGRYEPGLHSVRTLLSAPRFYGRPILTNAYVTWRYETDDVELLTLDDNRVDFSLEQRARPFSKLELTWGYSYGWREFTFVQQDGGQVLLDLSGVLAGVSASAVLDHRDNPFDATRGWLHSSSVQWGLQSLGSDLGYGRYLLRQFHYVPVGPLVLAGAARWGTIATFGGVAPVTALDQLFTAGGTTTVRGYREEELSALNILGVPIGGTELLILNGEVRFPLLKWVKGVAFADAGNTFEGQSALRVSDLAVGLGFGLRIKTPLAPIRIDLGFPSPRRPGEPRYRWHFSVGQMF